MSDLDEAKAANPDDYWVEPDFQVKNADLYKAYSKFCESNGEYKRSHWRLTKNMHERGFERRNSSGRYWRGIRLDDPEQT